MDIIRLLKYKDIRYQNLKTQIKMTRSILRAVIIGVIVGAMAFFMPHLLLGILVFMFLIRLFCCGGRGHGCCGHGYRHGHRQGRLFYMADKIRSMSEEEYAEFKEKMGGECCNSDSDCCGSKSTKSACCESKKEESTK